jgi:hypothetical protein
MLVEDPPGGGFGCRTQLLWHDAITSQHDIAYDCATNTYCHKILPWYRTRMCQ